MDVDVARQRLNTLLQELDSSAHTFEQEDGRSGGQPLSYGQEHVEEAAAVLTEQDRSDALREVVSDQRSQVVAALARLDAGTYGQCVQCGTQLSDERLEARPEAARCKTCQEQMEMAR